MVSLAGIHVFRLELSLLHVCGSSQAQAKDMVFGIARGTLEVVRGDIKQFIVGEQLDAPPSTDSDATCAQDGVTVTMLALAEQRGLPAVAALLRAAGSNNSTAPGKATQASPETFKSLCITQGHNCPRVSHNRWTKKAGHSCV